MRKINRSQILTRKSRKVLTIIILIFICLFLGIGYAYLNNNLNIAGTKNLPNSSKNIYFDNIVVKENNSEAVLPVTIKDKTKIDMNIILEKPGDVFSFNVDIVNAGTIDAILSDIYKTSLNSKQQEYFEYTIKYLNKDNLAKNDILKKNSRETINITVKYKDYAESVHEDLTLDLGFALNYLEHQ